MNNQQGVFISIEGVEGVGKSTLIKAIEKYLQQKNIAFIETREPGGTPIAEAVRNVLLGHFDETMCADTELLLMFAGRAQNISQVIRPALEQGKWVISDRFTDASFAYQGGGRGINKVHIAELAKWVQGDLKPNVTLLLDAPVELGLERVKSRGAKDRIETEGIAFFNRIRESYLALAENEPERFSVIDATQDVESVKRQALAIIDRSILAWQSKQQ